MKDGFLKHTGNLRHGAIVEWWENPEAARCELPMSRKVPTDFLVMAIAITNHGGFKAESIGNKAKKRGFPMKYHYVQSGRTVRP